MYFYTYTLILPKMNLQKAEYLKKKNYSGQKDPSVTVKQSHVTMILRSPGCTNA